jgi:hypothetical protein
LSKVILKAVGATAEKCPAHSIKCTVKPIPVYTVFGKLCGSGVTIQMTSVTTYTAAEE